MRRTVFLAATFVLGATGSARAESRSVRVEYQGARSCPDERQFIELARDRVRQWATIEEDGELVARATIEEQDAAFAGRLSIENAAGQSLGIRSIQGADCEDVALALALFLAVALEAEASNAHTPAAIAAEGPPDAPASEPRPQADERAPVPPSPPPRSHHASAIAWQLVTRAHGVIGRMPDPALGGAFAVELAPRQRSSMLRPFGTLGIDAAPYSERREGRGHVELSWGAIFGRVCAALDGGARDGRLELWACARVEGGGLRAASRGYAVNRTEYLPWYAAGLETGATVRLSHRLSIGAFAQAMAPLVRHELVLGERRVFRAPVLTGEAGLELKVRIW